MKWAGKKEQTTPKRNQPPGTAQDQTSYSKWNSTQQAPQDPAGQTSFSKWNFKRESEPGRASDQVGFSKWNFNRAIDSAVDSVRHFAGHLVFDSRYSSSPVLPLAAGLRSSPVPVPTRDACQLLFGVDEGRIEVDLELGQFVNDVYLSLIGQVAGAEGKIQRVYLTRQDQSLALETHADKSGTFRFQNLGAGDYQLKILTDQELIELAPVRL